MITKSCEHEIPTATKYFQTPPGNIHRSPCIHISRQWNAFWKAMPRWRNSLQVPASPVGILSTHLRLTVPTKRSNAIFLDSKRVNFFHSALAWRLLFYIKNSATGSHGDSLTATPPGGDISHMVCSLGYATGLPLNSTCAFVVCVEIETFALNQKRNFLSWQIKADIIAQASGRRE